jgi:ABC-2 type transport system ATP-binding protein
LADPQQRSEIGYLPELPYFYENLTVEQTLNLYGKLCGISGACLRQRTEALLDQFSLRDRRHSRLTSLSKGLKQRVGFAQAVINNPALLILDEPFSGLDPMARHEFKEIIKELKGSGTSILLCSHVLSDVEELCSRVTILVKGEVRREIDIADLHEMGRSGFELTLGVADLTKFQLDRLNPGSVEYLPARSVLSYCSEEGAQIGLKTACAMGLSVISFSSKAPTLEELFVELNSSYAQDSDNRPLYLS